MTAYKNTIWPKNEMSPEQFILLGFTFQKIEKIRRQDRPEQSCTLIGQFRLEFILERKSDF